MAVNMKLGVDLGSFNSGINQAKTQLRTFDAALKNAEAAFKATGDAESAMATKMTALNGKFQTQKKMVEDYRKVLEDMVKNGVDQTGAAYQKMQKDMLLAEAAMYDTQTAIDALNGSQEKAADSADKLSTSVSSIGKKMSLDQVISGINSITGGLEKAAGVALRLGEHIFDNIMTSAQWGDDIATQAMMAQMSVEDYQRVVNVAATQGETSVNSLIKSWKKLKTNMTGDSKEVAEALDELGVSMYENVGGKYGNAGPLRDYMDVYWEIGEALLAMGESAEQERYAQTLLGRSWQESIPMFRLGREEYEKLIAAQDVVSEESVNNLAELNDTVIGLEQQFNTLKNEVIAQFAPTFTEMGGVVSGLLSELNEYLKTDDGKQMLTDLGTAVSGLFEDLKDIDPQDVISGFTGVFNTVIDSLKWLDANKDTVVSALKYILEGWAVLKVTGTALQIVELFQGITGLAGGGAAAAGAAAGSSWGVAFAEAVAAAAPWLVGAYALLKPGETADDSFFNNKTGTLTDEGWRQFNEYAAGRIKDEGWDEIIGMVGNRYGGLSDILGNPAAINAMARALYGDHSFVGVDPMAQPELFRTRINNELFDALEGMGYQPRIEIEASEEVAEVLEKGTIELTAGDSTGRIKTPKGWVEPEVEVEPVPDPNAVEEISRAVGVVPIAAQLNLIGGIAGLGAGAYMGDLNKAAMAAIYRGLIPGFANGLPYVPRDGIYMLHKGETVNPSREVTSRNYSSNLYVEKMIMNNGTDAQGLAERMAAEQQRTMSGFGS
jgi:hypothetical protein